GRGGDGRGRGSVAWRGSVCRGGGGGVDDDDPPGGCRGGGVDVGYVSADVGAHGKGNQRPRLPRGAVGGYAGAVWLVSRWGHLQRGGAGAELVDAEPDAGAAGVGRREPGRARRGGPPRRC